MKYEYLIRVFITNRRFSCSSVNLKQLKNFPVYKLDPKYVDKKDEVLFDFLQQQFAGKDMIEEKADMTGKVMDMKKFRELINKTVLISPRSFPSFFGSSIGNMLRHALKRR